jgi:flagellar biosynthesis/type III secretory pathway chaperone
MRLALEDLTVLLGAEVRELRWLLALLEEQERVLLRGDATALAGLTTLEATLVRRLALLEDQRRVLVGRLARNLGAAPATLTLARLLELLPEPPPGLPALREELGGLLGPLRVLSARNGFLVERSLGYLDRLLSHLLAALSPGGAPTYAPDGRTSRAVPALRLIDRKA